MNDSGIVVFYSEIALKGANRPLFEKQLAANLQGALMEASIPRFKVRRLFGRLLVDGLPAEQRSKAVTALAQVFGVAHATVARITQPTIAAITATALEVGINIKGSFRVSARRASKDHKFNSMDLEKAVGAALQKATGAKVNLGSPAHTVFIDVLNKAAYVYRTKVKGPGGLPVGVSGRVVVLLSAGIDSPVAAWYLAKRGCPLTLVHFHSYPRANKRSQDNVLKLAKTLASLAPETKLYFVPLVKIQEAIIKHCQPKYRVLLYRRAMLRLATALATNEKAGALVTGESVGQVASQTIANIEAVSTATNLPILRPLCGFDKSEIIQKAQQIGTYEISIAPYEDCCSFMVPQKPETKARVIDLEKAEAALDFGDEFNKALGGAEIILFD